MQASRMLFLVLVLVLVLAPALGAAQPALAASVSADHDLAWMAGVWCGGNATEQVEEAWLEPQAGQLIGMSRTIAGGHPTGYEFMRIEPGPGGVPTFFAQPRGNPPTAFAASAAGPGWIRFANHHHDFPQWIEYRRQDERLVAAVGGPGGDGKAIRVDYSYARCDAAGG